jgi:hypothetical protein
MVKRLVLAKQTLKEGLSFWELDLATDGNLSAGLTEAKTFF